MGRTADIDELMYSCGLDVLHPGGLETTDEMARMCHIAKDQEVLDIGSGKGATACYLAGKYRCHVIGVDTSQRMIESAAELATNRGLQDQVTFRQADAQRLPFKDQSFNIVLAECTTVLVREKEKAFSEFLRVLVPGGYVGDLEMTWRQVPPKDLAERVREAWDGFTTMTLEQWKDLCERMGLREVTAADFSERIPDLEKAMMKEMRLRGTIKMFASLLLRPGIRRAVKEYRQLWHECGDYVGYGYVVGRKP